jgi:hypothetical protein
MGHAAGHQRRTGHSDGEAGRRVWSKLARLSRRGERIPGLALVSPPQLELSLPAGHPDRRTKCGGGISVELCQCFIEGLPANPAFGYNGCWRPLLPKCIHSCVDYLGDIVDYMNERIQVPNQDLVTSRQSSGDQLLLEFTHRLLCCLGELSGPFIAMRYPTVGIRARSRFGQTSWRRP